jgi:hypothetical protein
MKATKAKAAARVKGAAMKARCVWLWFGLGLADGVHAEGRPNPPRSHPTRRVPLPLNRRP